MVLIENNGKKKKVEFKNESYDILNRQLIGPNLFFVILSLSSGLIPLRPSFLRSVSET